MTNFEFHSPWFLILFLVFIPLIIKDLKTQNKTAILVPSIQYMRVSSLYSKVRFFLKISKYIILSLIPSKTDMKKELILSFP